MYPSAAELVLFSREERRIDRELRVGNAGVKREQVYWGEGGMRVINWGTMGKQGTQVEQGGKSFVSLLNSVQDAGMNELAF